MKKIISYITLFHILFAQICYFTFEIVKADEINIQETSFVVTAYYSPLPNQKYYFKWSYEADIILNGKWVTWASWKAVFSWMFAAPKTYWFWTKIYLEWVWIWEVADRWWAIVAADGNDSRWYDYDRIDIWMWFWEEGLARALAWWKKTIKWYVVVDNSLPISLDITNFPAPQSALISLAKKQELEKENQKAIEANPKLATFEKYISPNSSPEHIQMLQEVFSEMKLYTWSIDGKYESIESTLINYQLQKWIVKNATDDGAGYFWPLTRSTAKKEYIAYISVNKAQIEKENKIKAQINSIKTKIDTAINKHISTIWRPTVWAVGTNVRLLQKTLKMLGYFKGKDTGIFWPTTKQALIDFQLEKWIIQSANDEAAGIYGPKTQSALSTHLKLTLEEKVLESKGLLSYQ